MEPEDIQQVPEFLLRMGTLRFRIHLELPSPPSLDNLLYSLINTLSLFITKQLNISQAISQLNDIKKKCQKFKDQEGFMRTINYFEQLFQNPEEKLLWEITSDLKEYYHAYYEKIDSIKKQYVLQGIPNLPEDTVDISSFKPNDAKDPFPISFNMDDMAVVQRLSSFLSSVKSSCPECINCGLEPAKWYALPCSHGLYCDDCYQELKNSITTCPYQVGDQQCNQQITQLISL